MPLPSLLRAWKTKPWIKRLSGLTLRHSTATCGVESWIAFLPDSHVSLSPSPACDSPRTTPDGSGPTSQEYLVKYDPVSSSWKTCQGSFLPDLETFSGTWPRSGSMRNGVVFERAMSAPAIGGNGGSAWQTPRAIYGEHPGMVDPSHLTGQAQAGPTPDAGQYGSTTGKDGERRPLLGQMATRHWSTPQAQDAQGAKTPEQIATMRAKGHGVKNLNETAVNSWPTPKARDHRPGGYASEMKRNNPDLSALAVTHSHPAQTETGQPTLPNTRTLNPRFVEALMGWPIGWTDCERAVTALCHSKPRSRGEASAPGKE